MSYYKYYPLLTNSKLKMVTVTKTFPMNVNYLGSRVSLAEELVLHVQENKPSMCITKWLDLCDLLREWQYKTQAKA